MNNLSPNGSPIHGIMGGEKVIDQVSFDMRGNGQKGGPFTGAGPFFHASALFQQFLPKCGGGFVKSLTKKCSEVLGTFKPMLFQ